MADTGKDKEKRDIPLWKDISSTVPAGDLSRKIKVHKYELSTDVFQCILHRMEGVSDPNVWNISFLDKSTGGAQGSYSFNDRIAVSGEYREGDEATAAEAQFCAGLFVYQRIEEGLRAAKKQLERMECIMDAYVGVTADAEEASADKAPVKAAVRRIPSVDAPEEGGLQAEVG